MNEVLRSLGRSFIIFISLMALSIGSAIGQNLIHNPSFEDYIPTCENETIEVNYVDLTDWVLGICTFAPAFMTECNNDLFSPQYGVPNNAFGTQEAYDGTSYAASIVYRPDLVHSKQYLVTEFDTLLEVGVEYCLTLQMSLAGFSAYKNHSYSALFYGSYPETCNGLDTTIWRQLAQINFDITDVDTTTWTELSGSFTANGNEQFLVIGNFQVGHADVTYIGPSPAPWQWSLYYMDMVSLVRCDEVGISETRTQDIQLFPNPAHDHFTITVPESFIGGYVAISTALGQNVQRQQILSSQQQINLDQAVPGVYFVRVVKNDQVVNLPFVLE